MFSLTAGTTLTFLVGGKPPEGGGGGGSFVFGATTFAMILISITIVPEPSTWAMTLAGFAGLGWLAHMRRRKLGRA